MRVLCDECDTMIDTDEDFSMFVTLDEGLESERKLCFCSMMCATRWTDRQGNDEE